jgi:exonuclease SbcC
MISKEADMKNEQLKGYLQKKKEHVEKSEKFDIRKIDELKKEVDELREKKHLTDMLNEKENRRLKLIESLKNIKKDIGIINVEKIKLRNEIEKLKDIENEYLAIKKEFEVIREEEKQILVKKTSIEKEIEGIEKIIEILDRNIDEKIKTKEKIKQIKNYKEWLERYFMQLMNNMERHVMVNIHREFNELFQHWFSMLMEDENLNVRLDNSFTPIIEQNGYESFVENLSGGEKTAAALAYRLALNRVINELVSEIKTKDLIILDEPTDGFSSEQLDKVREVLDEIGTKQTIIVSHESKIESFVDNVIRVRKNEHISNII